MALNYLSTFMLRLRWYLIFNLAELLAGIITLRQDFHKTAVTMGQH